MIFIDRSQATEPEVLNRIFADGLTETERALAHYAEPWDGTSYDFTRYSNDQVKQELEKMFHGKCAYCESFFGHISPEDIEHWRPKGAVILENGSVQKPAYYWLAASWENLLPSCIDCNRKRRQEDVRDPTNQQSGKQNLFPVAEENHRWTHPDQAHQNGEMPLILDPCKAGFDPSVYFTVSEKAVVMEKEPEGQIENRQARSSINVFGLNRSNLVQVREKHRLAILALLKDIDIAILTIEANPPRQVEDLNRQQIRDKLAELKKERAQNSPYLMMKAPLIDNFIADRGSKLQSLGFGL